MDECINLHLCTRLAGMLVVGLSISPALGVGMELLWTQYSLSSPGVLPGEVSFRHWLLELVRSVEPHRLLVEAVPAWLFLFLGLWLLFKGPNRVGRLMQRALSHA